MSTADSCEPVLRWLAERPEVSAVAGPLSDRVLAADVDAADTGADAEAGEAAAEELVAFAEDRGLPWLLRASGRPGGFHVLVVAELVELGGEWTLACQRAGRHHGVGVSARRTLRLLSSPHRLGFAAPVLAATLSVEDVPAPVAEQDADGRGPRRGGRRRRGSRPGMDRSRAEFGDALARARAGWGPGRAWAAANVPGSKAAEMGELDWRRWVWAPAVTVVAAEQGLDEVAAWRRFAQASPRRARQLGIEAWRETYWRPAVVEAGRARPRRRRTDRSGPTPRPAAVVAAEQREIDVVRTGLRQAAEEAVAVAGRRPQFARSLAAALDALAEAIVRRDGSISERDWALAARLDRKTLRAVRDFAAERGVLYRAVAYEGGSEHCAAWRPGPASQHLIQQLRETSTTRWYTPPARTRGRANPDRQRRRFARDRHHWRLRCQVSADAEATGTSYARSQHPAAKTLRSLWHQRRWWNSLTPDQREQRRRARRTLLGRLHRQERRAWFTWLDRRWRIVHSAERVDQGLANHLDEHLLAHAPAIIHLGMRDPSWRTGGTAPTLPARREEHPHQNLGLALDAA